MLNTALLDDLLKNLLKQVPELLGVLVVDLDGLIIAQQSVKEIREDMIGAVMSVVEQTMERIKKFTETSYGSARFDTNDFQLFYVELGGSNPALFILVADPYSDLERVIPYSYIIAEKVSKILNFQDVSINLPDFNHNGNNNIIDIKNNSHSNEFTNLKILLIGHKEVGKSTLQNIYVNGNISEEYKPTIGVSYIRKKFSITSDNKLQLHLFDISGLRSFAKIRKYYYPKADAVIILFDYSRKETLEDINEWIEEAKFFINNSGIPYFLVGNKVDLIQERDDLRKKAKRLAVQYDCSFFEISSVTGQGIDELFTQLISNLLN
ncbi:MAG: GTP-binding protein [Candidatus Lokiarchaeota archaeon]|nr:GTP-binding protein [Candidatus Lokiarchaeota archaeon]